MLCQASVLAFVICLASGLNPDPMVDIVFEQPEASSANIVSNKLSVAKTEVAKDGEAFTISCSVPDHADIELCTWNREGLSPLFLQESGLYDYKRNKIEGVSVVQSNKK